MNTRARGGLRGEEPTENEEQLGNRRNEERGTTQKTGGQGFKSGP